MTKVHRAALAASFVLFVNATVFAQDVLIRGARVHTAAPAGTLESADVLVRGGIIRAVGPALSAPNDVSVVDAQRQALTPGLFGGLTGLGIEEVSAEPSK